MLKGFRLRLCVGAVTLLVLASNQSLGEIDVGFNNLEAYNNPPLECRGFDWGPAYVNELRTAYLGSHTGIDLCRGVPTNLAFGQISMIGYEGMAPLPNPDSCGSGDCGLGNSVIIKHLMDDGSYKYALFGHLANHRVPQKLGTYVVPSQVIGDMGNSSTQYVHLHLEIKNDNRLGNPLGRGWGYIPYQATPEDDDLDPLNFGYENPNTFISNTENKIALPFISTLNTSANEGNYVVFAYHQSPINGRLKLSGTFEEASIIVRNFFNRAEVFKKGDLKDDTRFLGGKNQNSPVTFIEGTNSYDAGDYLFAAYVKAVGDNENRFGYPLKFSFVNESEFIIDNDQRVSSDNEFTHSGNNSTPVPGYFLTSLVTNGNTLATWRPSRKGRFLVSVFVPESTLPGSYVYRVCPGRDAECFDADLYLQSPMPNNSFWQPLVNEKQQPLVVNFDTTGSISIRTNNGKNGDRVFIDAIKFSHDTNNLQQLKDLLSISESSAHKVARHYMEGNQESSVDTENGTVQYSIVEVDGKGTAKYSLDDAEVVFDSETQKVVIEKCAFNKTGVKGFIRKALVKAGISDCEGV